jgi:hypothetical protein
MMTAASSRNGAGIFHEPVGPECGTDHRSAGG